MKDATSLFPGSGLRRGDSGLRRPRSSKGAVLERPAFKKLVEAGDIEVLADEAVRPRSGGGSSGPVHDSTHGHPAPRNTGHKRER